MWRPIHNPDLGLMNVFKDVVVRHQCSNPAAFPELRESPSLFVASDYGGHHKQSLYESYGFIYVSSESWAQFDMRRLAVRRRFGIGERSFAFKKLDDQRKRDALGHFLSTADCLQGMAVTVLVKKSVGSLFPPEQSSDHQEAATLWPNIHFNSGTFERLMRVLHFN